MNIRILIKSVIARLLIILGKRTPLRVTHFITYRCNLKCEFCKLPQNDFLEMTTQEIENTMLTFKKMGTIAWGFTGGEPFIRPDIIHLTNFAKKKCNFLTSVVTNGTLTDRISEISNDSLDFLMISIEGTKEKNDKIRGKDNFVKILNTLQIIKTKNIKTVSLECVIQDNNLDDIKFIIDLAKRFNLYCGFQPIFDPLTGKEDKNVLIYNKKIKSLRENIKYIITQIEKEKNKYILTPPVFLKYCLNYGADKFRKNKCFAGLLYCHMEPDGSIKNCLWWGNKDIKNFDNLSKPFKDCYCWPKCHGEYSSVFSFNIQSIKNVIQKFI